MQSIKRLVHAKNNRVWSVKQTTSGGDPGVLFYRPNTIFRMH